MRTMIDLGSQRGLIHIIDTATAVDCTKDVGFRRSFRSLVGCMVPCCGFQPSDDDAPEGASDTDTVYSGHSSSSIPAGVTTTTVSGTFFGHRRGRVSFCLHRDSSKTWPFLLLEFAVPTAYLAKEMQHGLLRIALECDRSRARSSPLYAVPTWSMYCNGRKVGFAVRRQVREGDAAVFKLMHSVSVGAGVLPGKFNSDDGDLLYLRASFQRVVGSVDSESLHMINPAGSTGQQLSIFLLRN